ncbi:MAG: Stp1/IreP family PP2C-type Ser/Thr phosphatase [Clostridiales bacterium]|nr:Stp1/IreP family PP2C-type Ser/Thr phosphatase [Candidatus Crickella merdequi]
MKIGYMTDKGRRRPKNEDALRVLPGKNFFMLADGVGGNKSGEVASKTALDALERFIEHNPLERLEGRDEIFRYFEAAVDFVNQMIIRISTAEPAFAGMATTLVFVYIRDRIAYISNVGDSRVYAVHNSQIHQITEDHTYVNDLVKMGAITREEAEHHNKKNVITRAIGANACSIPDCFNIFIQPGDRILICSDGLYDEVNETAMLERLIRDDDMADCAEDLVKMANDNGGNDNISVICIEVSED